MSKQLQSQSQSLLSLLSIMSEYKERALFMQDFYYLIEDIEKSECITIKAEYLQNYLKLPFMMTKTMK